MPKSGTRAEGDDGVRRTRKSSRTSANDLFALAYADLRRLAHRYMVGQPPGHLLETTALVHEAYMRLCANDGRWTDRDHFLAVVARAMRQVLVDHARAAAKSKGRRTDRNVESVTVPVLDGRSPIDVLVIDEVLSRLTAFDEELARIAEMRIFGGLGLPEVARALDMKLRTVERRWQLARAWLRGELARGAAARPISPE